MNSSKLLPKLAVALKEAAGGYDYEVAIGVRPLCSGWARGSRVEAKREALEHARTTLERRSAALAARKEAS